MWQLIASLVSSAASAYGANKQGRVSTQNAREQRAWQTQMSNTAHTREVADLRNAGLNPILSSKNSGAPTGAGAMAQAPDYAKAYGDAAMKAAQLRLIDSQARKTSAEATIAENHENQSKVESELYGSGVGMIPVATKAIGPYASKAAAAIGSSARSAYRGVRNYFKKKPKSFKPRKGKYSSNTKAKARSVVHSYKKPSHQKRRRGGFHPKF